jgi:preprotein translocase subunit Sss1
LSNGQKRRVWQVAHKPDTEPAKIWLRPRLCDSKQRSTTCCGRLSLVILCCKTDRSTTFVKQVFLSNGQKRRVWQVAHKPDTEPAKIWLSSSALLQKATFHNVLWTTFLSLLCCKTDRSTTFVKQVFLSNGQKRRVWQVAHKPDTEPAKIWLSSSALLQQATFHNVLWTTFLSHFVLQN